MRPRKGHSSSATGCTLDLFATLGNQLQSPQSHKVMRRGRRDVIRIQVVKKLVLAATAALILPVMAQAHFLLEYTEDTMIARPGDVPVKLVFWHPHDAGHVMTLEKPEEFYVIHNGKKTDLMDTLKETTFDGPDNTAKAFMGSVPVKRSGDYVLVTVPAPYYEESEDIYIQQITKTYLNRNELPTDWDQPQGLPTEILPLNKPYNVIAGGTFTGRVLSEGQPVTGAEIEIEYMAAEPDLSGTGAKAKTASPLPGGALVAISDDNGYFTFGVPKAGLWGFAALGVGPKVEHDGKELSQDAVIWIRAWDLE
ncbi:cobalt/nickel transport protein [Shimia sagamensis]|uniref:Cobalt/nickel transport protein n=1 Tax=Shimia sagamensis TaxID=1566352 RepID=A0ABY1NTQ8_9RHOB|nr:cobalt/nickel transport protein [Shimia sagamensis]